MKPKGVRVNAVSPGPTTTARFLATRTTDPGMMEGVSLERYAKPGAILGHEWSGIVAEAPSGSGWTPGDRVVGNAAPGCGVCRPCRRGRPSVCLRRATADFAGYRGAF